jgi:hypothetical protein
MVRLEKEMFDVITDLNLIPYELVANDESILMSEKKISEIVEDEEK